MAAGAGGVSVTLGGDGFGGAVPGLGGGGYGNVIPGNWGQRSVFGDAGAQYLSGINLGGLTFPVFSKPQFYGIADLDLDLTIDRRDIVAEANEVEMAHIFGIPHSVSGIIGGIVEGVGSIFGGPGPMQLPQAPPDFYSGWDITASAPQLAIEGLNAFSDVWNESKELNVANGNGTVGTFLGCPVEEESGCEPHKKRYTVTIDNATGKCIKIKRQKSRKRRRRLASLSDIKDLAALKQVIGGGKAFDTWIATRGR